MSSTGLSDSKIEKTESKSLNPAQRLIEFGQSVWYDNISRDLIDSGELKRLVSEWGVRGLTSNPSIFEKAIKEGSQYRDLIEDKKQAGLNREEIFEEIAVSDIIDAAKILEPVYQASGGEDGYVSIEVSPLLAKDAQGSVEEGKRLHSKIARPNIMIKIPGTEEGCEAIKALLEAGISVNVTLLFSLEDYERVAWTYIEALESRANRGEALDSVSSVASFFVSRADTAVDKSLEDLGLEAQELSMLRGKFAVANAKLVYERFSEIFSSDRFQRLAEKGARVQRPLWASTGTKNPLYSDVMYVDELVGSSTVNTLPHNTLEAFVDHGLSGSDSFFGENFSPVSKDLESARELVSVLKERGVDLAAILATLKTQGISAFESSYRSLLESIDKA